MTFSSPSFCYNILFFVFFICFFITCCQLLFYTLISIFFSPRFLSLYFENRMFAFALIHAVTLSTRNLLSVNIFEISFFFRVFCHIHG